MPSIPAIDDDFLSYTFKSAITYFFPLDTQSILTADIFNIDISGSRDLQHTSAVRTTQHNRGIAKIQRPAFGAAGAGNAARWAISFDLAEHLLHNNGVQNPSLPFSAFSGRASALSLHPFCSLKYSRFLAHNTAVKAGRLASQRNCFTAQKRLLRAGYVVIASTGHAGARSGGTYFPYFQWTEWICCRGTGSHSHRRPAALRWAITVCRHLADIGKVRSSSAILKRSFVFVN